MNRRYGWLNAGWRVGLALVPCGRRGCARAIADMQLVRNQAFLRLGVGTDGDVLGAGPAGLGAAGLAS
jgi:hypothetical protein